MTQLKIASNLHVMDKVMWYSTCITKRCPWENSSGNGKTAQDGWG